MEGAGERGVGRRARARGRHRCERGRPRSDRAVEATVALGDLSPDDVTVQLAHGPVGQGDEITDVELVTMALVGTHAHEARYRGEFRCAAAGRYGFTVRVLPAHPDLAQPVELGRIVWA